MARSETRSCSEECSARCMYQSVGVVRNSLIARRASSGSGIGSMKPEWVSTSSVIGPMGRWAPRACSGLPESFSIRATVVAIGLRSGRGTKIGAPIEENVSPGTPPTASSPVTRSGWVTATSNMVFTPIDHPISTQASMPSWSITAIASSAKSSMSTRSGSAGRSEPPVPRWFQETTCTPQAGSSSAGQL